MIAGAFVVLALFGLVLLSSRVERSSCLLDWFAAHTLNGPLGHQEVHRCGQTLGRGEPHALQLTQHFQRRR